VEKRSSGHRPRVAIGIFCSRVTGLIRQRVFAHYFGLGPEADAFYAALRIPNFLQNLFGEGALSASFIPVYAGLLARGERQAADRVAGAVAALLALVVSILVLIGVLATPIFIDVIAPGFHGDTRTLTIDIVRVLFPGTGLLVLSAWCLGVLNSHHRFLLSYASGVMWNVAMIATLLFGGRTSLPTLAVYLGWGSVAGSALQFGVQIPFVLRLAPDLRVVLDTASADVRTVVRNFLPAFVSRGVVQLSGYIDTLLATWLPGGAVSALSNATTLTLLPGACLAWPCQPPAAVDVGCRERGWWCAAERCGSGSTQDSPDRLSSSVGDGVPRWRHRGRSAAPDRPLQPRGFAIRLGHPGRFGCGAAGTDARPVVFVDVLRPSRHANAAPVCRRPRDPHHGARLSVRVLAAGPAGPGAAMGCGRAHGIGRHRGWAEMLMLRRTMNGRIGRTGLSPSYVAALWSSAAAGAAVGWAIKLALPALHPVLAAVLILGPYGVVFAGMTLALGVPEAGLLLRWKRRT
jgi:putative peptidoglycan lipid II flippase